MRHVAEQIPSRSKSYPSGRATMKPARTVRLPLPVQQVVGEVNLQHAEPKPTAEQWLRCFGFTCKYRQGQGTAITCRMHLLSFLDRMRDLPQSRQSLLNPFAASIISPAERCMHELLHSQGLSLPTWVPSCKESPAMHANWFGQLGCRQYACWSAQLRPCKWKSQCMRRRKVWLAPVTS